MSIPKVEFAIAGGSVGLLTDQRSGLRVMVHNTGTDTRHLMIFDADEREETMSNKPMRYKCKHCGVESNESTELYRTFCDGCGVILRDDRGLSEASVSIDVRAFYPLAIGATPESARVSSHGQSQITLCLTCARARGLVHDAPVAADGGAR